MAKSLPTPAIAGFIRPVRRRTTCPRASLHPSPRKAFTTSPPSRDEREDTSRMYGNEGRNLREGPRWPSTPPRMTAPLRSKPPVFNNDFAVNKDPEKLDRVYKRMFGDRGHSMLTEEVKWLAVTHKSFDHGRRGYNDRLAFLGKTAMRRTQALRVIEYVRSPGRRIVELQTSLALLHGASATDIPTTQDQYGREPFQHPALQGVNGLTAQAKAMTLEKHRMAKLAERYGLDGVIRWKPKRVSWENLSQR